MAGQVSVRMMQEGLTAKCTAHFAEVVAASFAVDGARQTRDEVKRRFNICMELFGNLRYDMQWGFERIFAPTNLPYYLRCELDGHPWEPDPRTCWIPDDGAVQANT